MMATLLGMSISTKARACSTAERPEAASSLPNWFHGPNRNLGGMSGRPVRPANPWSVSAGEAPRMSTISASSPSTSHAKVPPALLPELEPPPLPRGAAPRKSQSVRRVVLSQTPWPSLET